MAKRNSIVRKFQNDSLCKEILVTIFMYLNAADIAAASMVCKAWKEACRAPSLWDKLDLSRISSYCINVPKTLEAYKRSSSTITQFLKYLLSLSNGNTTCIIFNYYIYLTDEQFITVAERTPNLKRLVLPATGDLSRAGVSIAMRSWEGLQSITLTNVVPGLYIFPAIHKYCKNVAEMKFSYGCLFEEKHAKAIIQYTPNLKMLSIRNILVSPKALCTVMTSLEHLVAVNICHSFLINVQALQNQLPAPIMDKLIFCIGGWCLRCKNRCDREIFPFSTLRWRSKEDVWREDEITSLSH